MWFGCFIIIIIRLVFGKGKEEFVRDSSWLFSQSDDRESKHGIMTCIRCVRVCVCVLIYAYVKVRVLKTVLQTAQSAQSWAFKEETNKGGRRVATVNTAMNACQAQTRISSTYIYIYIYIWITRLAFDASTGHAYATKEEGHPHQNRKNVEGE